MIRPALIYLASFSLVAAQQTPPATTAVPPEQVQQVPEPGRFQALFQPFRTDRAALSPDGKYLAYSVRENDTMSVVVIEIDHPEKITARVQVVDANAATPMLAADQREQTPGQINWMRWVSPTRVVVETNQVFGRSGGTDAGWQSWRGAVVGFDADGTNAKLLARPEDLDEFAGEATGTSPFSIARGRGTLFDSRVVTADQPLPTAGGDDEPTVNPVTELPLDYDRATPPLPDLSARQPRTLRVFDLDPNHPGNVTLIATGAPRDSGAHSLGHYTLDTRSGKVTNLADGLVLNTRTALLDRQGHIRLTLPDSLLSSFPFVYDYRGPRGQDRPKPLATVTGLPGFSVSPGNYFGERAIPLGFDEDPNVLYYASNLGRDTYGIYSVHLNTGRRGRLTMENPAYDLIGPPDTGFPDRNTLVFDRYTRQLVGVRYDNALRTTAWTRPEWQALQAEFEKTFPGRSVEISDWDAAGKRFLVSTESPADPGAFFVYDRDRNKLSEFVRRAPWIDANHTHVTLPFSFEADGARISGLVTVPQHPRLKPIPMVVLCPDLPWERVRSDFQTEVQALADMGFVVVQLNDRGVWGLGLKQRQTLTAGYDLVQVEDIAATITNLEKIFDVNLKRVALLGRGHGGFIALRTLQTYPDKFRCAIALDAPVNLADWLELQKWSNGDVQPQLTRAWFGDEARLKAAPLTSHPEAIKKPVLLLNYPGPDGAPRHGAYLSARRFAEAVRAHGGAAEFGDLRTDYVNGLPAARAAVFDRIEEFLNINVYDFKVKVPDFKVIKQSTP